MIESIANRLRTIAGTSLLLLLTSTAYAQDWAFELWHEGKIVLETGDTLKGLVKYDLMQDMVQYTLHDRKAEAYTARKVLFFEIFDATIHKYRQFFTLPFAVGGSYKTPIFFELLEEGKMTLLARERLEVKTYSSPYYVGSYSRQVMVYYYFLLKDDGTIEPFLGNKNDLLDKMGKHSEAVEKYIKANRLKFEDPYDLAKIVAYYNSLFKS
jgi:hypothetical protein